MLSFWALADLGERGVRFRTHFCRETPELEVGAPPQTGNFRPAPIGI